MASKEFKVLINGDASGLQKASKQASSDMKALRSTTEQATSKLADDFGVPIDKLKMFASALRGVATQAEQTGAKGAKAMKALATAASTAGVAIAAIGIGAAVAAFKSLSAEAENFKSTWNGMEIGAGLDAYVDTYKQVFHDLNAEIGESTAQLGATLQKKWTTIWTGIKAAAVGVFSGKGIGASISETQGNAAIADAAARQAAGIAQQITALRKSWVGEGAGTQNEGLQTKLARLDAERAKWQLVAYDATVSAEERQQAMAKVVDLINQKYNVQIEYQRTLATLTREQTNLAGSTFEQMQAAANEETKLVQLEAQRDTELRSLSRRQASITNELTKQRQEEEKALQAEIDRASADLGASVQTEVDDQIEADLNTMLAQTELDPLKVEVEPDLNVEALDTAIIDINGALQSFAQDSAVAIGELIGDLATGGDAWGNFGQTAINAFADMAMSIGKLTMAAGMAALSIESLVKDPVAAIVAGAALVALGAAAKAAMSNITASRGNYTANASVASSGYGSSASSVSGYEHAITVDVTGTLKADGSQLVAVLNNEGKRKNATT